ncbi:hypothetical protein PN498_22985 [Oscillatoria sp. CS-180]|uniref:hypothetical protein n=1 Tax=Oscillatoria sp. CS-180 TaxID=3021720 RepID=UPI00232DFBDB|nr:hypothetical protein [Oscillatoria sp. CS-180]MDB9528877.1 hypothetical protein [Oscillatoria sp. CS-180]
MNSSLFTSEGSPNLSEDEALSTFINSVSIEMPSISQLGELPAVQDHFQTVLKRRLQIEISQNPPLFPWESNLTDYPAELSADGPLPWMSQLRSLPLPTSLPEDILTGLLNRCQELVAETLQPGIQLVKAVETLFPDQPQAMEQIAGLVLANATVRGTATRDMEGLKAAFPDGYEGANPQQQVTLTMLAAKDILDALMLTLSRNAPSIEREWQTTEGNMKLSAQYQSGTPGEIRISAEMPQAGQLSLPSVGQTVAQNRPGELTLTLPAPAPNVIYPLEVHLAEADAMPLTFAIRWIDKE